MVTPRLTILLLLTSLSLGCSDQSALEANSTASTNAAPAFASANATEQFRQVIDFVLTPEQCPSISTVITGSGVFHGAFHVSPKGKSGLFNFSFHSNYTGTATGEDGTSYRFAYNNEYRDSGEPEPPFVATILDRFFLVGLGSTPDVRVQSRVTLRFNSDNTVTPLKVVLRGDPPACDAI
jgi:hypothetical protein